MNYLYEVGRGTDFTHTPRLLTLLIHNFMGIMEKKYSGQDFING